MSAVVPYRAILVCRLNFLGLNPQSKTSLQTMKPMPPMKISPIIVRHTTQSPENAASEPKAP